MVTATGPGFEGADTFCDTVFDGRVAADLEVEHGDLCIAPPITSVASVALLEVEGSGDHFLALLMPRECQLYRVSLGPPQGVKQGSIKVAASPREPVHCRRVESECEGHMRWGDVISGQ